MSSDKFGIWSIPVLHLDLYSQWIGQVCAGRKAKQDWMLANHSDKIKFSTDRRGMAWWELES